MLYFEIPEDSGMQNLHLISNKVLHGNGFSNGLGIKIIKNPEKHQVPLIFLPAHA